MDTEGNLPVFCFSSFILFRFRQQERHSGRVMHMAVARTLMRNMSGPCVCVRV